MKEITIRVGEVVLKRFDEKSLESWTNLSKEECNPDIYRRIVDRSAAVILERGNNPRLICNRAREKTNFIIRVLQVALTTNRFIHDEETLFKTSEWVVYKRNGVVQAWWKGGYKPLLRELDKSLERNINSFLENVSDVLIEGKLPPRLRKCFLRALAWIGKSIAEENPDLKIVYLSTALESILSTRDDKKKGETLAYRMLLLNVFLGKTFAHPARILWIYELRSRIIHGSEISVASRREYLTMRRVARNTMKYAIEVIKKTSAKNKKRFIQAIESQEENVKKILDWLNKQGDEYSNSIKEHMKKRLIG